MKTPVLYFADRLWDFLTARHHYSFYSPPTFAYKNTAHFLIVEFFLEYIIQCKWTESVIQCIF